MIDPIGITTAREQIARTDVLAADMFAKMLLVAPFVAVFTRDEHVHVLDVMDCFAAKNKEEAAIKKLAFVPTVHKFIAQHELDVSGYVFAIQGYVAPIDSEVAKKELAAGKQLKDVSVRQNAVIYASERYVPEISAGVDGVARYPVDGIEYAFGQRIIQVYPKKLRELEITVLTREPKRMGFGVLTREKAKGPEIE